MTASSTKTPIVFPLHKRGGKFKDNTELRFALRALHKHFKGDYEVVIVTQKMPPWLSGVKHIYGEGLKSSLKAAADAFPDGFIWVYDDMCLLKDTDRETMKVTPACKGWSKAQTRWSRSLLQVKARLDTEGFPAFDYSRPHGPYWYDKSMVDEAFDDWPGMKGKFPFESWILSKRNHPRCHGMVKQYYGSFVKTSGKPNLPGENQRYLNYNDRGNTIELRQYLLQRFPEPSPWESVEKISKMTLYEIQSQNLFDEWKAAGSPHLRTICEVAIGPWSLLSPFKGFMEKAMMIEPDPEMARVARGNYPWATISEVAITDKIGTANLRKLKGSSYVKGIGWAPAFDKIPEKEIHRAGKTKVSTVTFDKIDDGRIDLINIDCEGSEWFVLQAMISRPKFIQIEIYETHPHASKMFGWFKNHGYREIRRWGDMNANFIFVRQA